MRIVKLCTYAVMLFLAIFLLSAVGCKKGQVITVKTDFAYEVIDSSFTIPVKLKFTNNSSGANHYKWTFEGGTPATSDKIDPGVITFNEAGSYNVKLEAWNEDSRNEKTATIVFDSAVSINFDAEVLVNNYAPANVKITNKTTGAINQQWNFPGAEVSESTNKDPGTITYNNPGKHTITLTVSNGRKKFTLSKDIEILPSLSPSFEIVPSFEDDDYQAPLTATLNNKTNAQGTWKWTAPNGKISNDTAQFPTIIFASSGIYTVTLSANNKKETKTFTQTITVLPNTNLRIFSDIKLGISMAHSSIGSFFSTTLRKTFTSADDLSNVGSDIDIVYYGLNKNFAYNRFVSADSAAFYTFDAIPNAKPAIVINSMENCNCGAFTADMFDNMATDALFQNLPINYSQAAWAQFNNTVTPRIVLYKTFNGRKGAIKVKKFVQDGNQSYILCDIKVQKEP